MLNYYLLCKLNDFGFVLLLRSDIDTEAGVQIFVLYFDKVPTLAMLELMCVCACDMILIPAGSTLSTYRLNASL